MQEKFHVFVIEDDKHLQKMLLDYLNHEFPDIEISLYKTGEDALIDMNLNPHLIVLDYYLSQYDKSAMDGLTVLSHIRQLNKSTRVVMFTGQEDPEVAAAAMKMGAYDYVVKSSESFAKLGDIIRHLKGHLVVNSPAFNRKLLIIVLIGILMLSVLLLFRH
ncbi:MAG: response regulator [Bacteroidetes bacterium]|jgi:DNA-binding NtrC family response regulator|nr:response regulator [Bacteroidota bacterium]